MEALESDASGNVQSVQLKGKSTVKAESVIIGIGNFLFFLRGEGGSAGRVR